MSHTPPNETVDVLLDVATPILDLLEQGLDLAPIPGLGLIPKALSTIVDQVKVTITSNLHVMGHQLLEYSSAVSKGSQSKQGVMRSLRGPGQTVILCAR